MRNHRQPFLMTLITILVLMSGLVFAADRGFQALEQAMVFRNSHDPQLMKTLDEIEPALQARIHNVYFPATDGTRLNGWYIPASPGYPTAVFAHGNGGNMGWCEGVLRVFSRTGYGILAFDYRGYGNSSGTPSEKGVYSDFEGASRYLTQTQHIPRAKQIAAGQSLGAAVAIDAASRNRYMALVAMAPFSSMPNEVRYLREQGRLGALDTFHTVPVEKLMVSKFDSIHKISRVHSPVLLVHGDEDTYVPTMMSYQLYSKVTAPCKKRVIIQGADHRAVFTHHPQQVMDALHTLLTCSKAAN